MRIGMFTDSYPPFINGVSTSIETLKGALEEKGHTVYVVTVGQDSSTYHYDEEKRILKVPGIPIGIYDYRVTSIYPVRIINQIKDWNLDVIHSHTESTIGLFARLMAKQYHIPLVHTYHTMYKDYTYYVSRNHKLFDLGCKKVVEYLSKFYCDNTADAFIVPTNKTYRVFREEYHYDKDIYVIPTGIDAKRFYRENVDLKKVEKLRKSYGFRKKDFVVLFVGRLAQEKNIDFLLRVMQRIKKHYSNIKLLIVGDGPDRERYEADSKMLDVENVVVFAGKVAWTDVPLYYHMANCFITASITETQGLTVIEALAADLPVTCIRDTAFEDMVEEGVNGYYFQTEEECAALLKDLAFSPTKLEELKKNGRKSIEKYSLEQFATSVEEVYQKAIEKHHNKKDLSIFVTNTFKKIFKKKEKKDDTSFKS